MSELMALCPVDGEPLICTLAFSKAEFICLACGRLYGWLDPRGADPTPELDARYEALKAEWDEHAGGKLIGGGVMLTDCTACSEKGEPHIRHATDAEVEAHRGALSWLKLRAAAGARA